MSVGPDFPDKEQILIINSSNGTSHVYSLKKTAKLNETPVQKTAVGNEEQNLAKVCNLVPKSRFKYKSLIKQGELKIVSMVSQKGYFPGNH